MYVIGIDPGFKGGVAFYEKKTNALDIRRLPLKKVFDRKQIDGEAFAELINLYFEKTKFAAVEAVRAMPNQGVTSMLRYGYSAGILTGVLNAYRVKILPLQPDAWKSAVGLTRDKMRSIEMAKELFPIHADKFQRVGPDDGIAEAAIIAHFAAHSLA